MSKDVKHAERMKRERYNQLGSKKQRFALGDDKDKDTLTHYGKPVEQIGRERRSDRIGIEEDEDNKFGQVDVQDHFGGGETMTFSNEDGSKTKKEVFFLFFNVLR